MHDSETLSFGQYAPARDAPSPGSETPLKHVALAADVGFALTKGATLRESLQRCCEAFVRHLGAAFARIWTVDTSGETLELQASAGRYTHIDGGHARVPVGSLKIGLIAAERAPHLTNDVQHDPRVGDPAWAAREGMVAFAGYPLELGGELLGVMAMFARAPLDQTTIAAIAAVADVIALGIERKRSLAALRSREARLRLFADATNEGIWFFDTATGALECNERLYALLGLDRERAPRTFDALLALVHPDDRDRLRRLVDDQHACDAPFGVDALRLRHASGEHRLCSIRGRAMRAEGEIVLLAGGVTDVTEARAEAEAERFLADASATLVSSIDYEVTLASVARLAVPRVADWCAVDLLDERGRIRRLAVAHVDAAKVALAHELEQRWPPKLEDPSGVGAVIRTRTPEVLGTIPDALVDRTPDPELRAIVKELGLCSSICVPLVARDRTLGAVTLVSAESGRHYGARDVRVAEELARRAAMAIDNAALYADARAALAARDQAVAELQDLTASLERRVAERTALLTESNRELEAFSYTVSHDLRAPIRHVAGFVDLLERSAGGQLDARARHYVATIKGAAQQMGTLIDALLAFSRIGRTDLARRPVDLRPVVLDVVRELQPDLAGRDVRIDVDPDLPTVLGDAIMLRVALTNLLSNAVKYTRGPATARIEVRRAARERPGEAVIRVSDNGIGFNMAYESKLFGVFQRLHNNPAFEGTGIGLATVRRIVTRHGGRVWAASTEGAGATFYVALPEAPSTSIERTESAR